MRRVIHTFMLILLGITLIIVSSPHTASALAFNQNRIMDDGVFNNASSMNAAQIDNWINTNFGSASCISTSHGFSAPDPIGYNYSQGFLYGGDVSAGQVIFDAAQAYGVNPQVLITTIQKEQGLVDGSGPQGAGCTTLGYAAALGYGCPDGGTTYSYSGVDLYSINGTEVTSVSGTCVNTLAKVGFSQQVIHAAWLLKFGQQRSEGNINWAVVKGNWDNSDDPQTCYSGPMTQGTWVTCPSGSGVYYDGNYTIDGTSVYLESGATAALYWYTPHFPGNENFFNIFTSWFGSTLNYIPPTCNAKIAGISCVWHLDHPGTDADFLTNSSTERDTAVNSSYYIYEDLAFGAFTSQQPGTIPVYRIRLSNEHFYTTSTSEMNSLLQNSQNTYEGIAFYELPGNPNTNATYQIYRLDNSAGHRFVSDPSERDTLESEGYTYEGIAFNAPSGFISTADPSINYLNVYRLRTGNQHLYTTSLSETDRLVSSGWAFEGGMFQAPAAATSTPIYRLYNNSSDHVYTPSSSEKASLVNSGWSYEGIAWYTDNTTPQTYRFIVNGEHFYTANLDEAFSIADDGGHFESIAFGYRQSTNVPVYRSYNGTYHFFTGDVSEALSNESNGWKNEGIAWYASPSATTQPVYRLVDGSQHFYTVSNTEVSELTSNGWKNEGIAWYGY